MERKKKLAKDLFFFSFQKKTGSHTRILVFMEELPSRQLCTGQQFLSTNIIKPIPSSRGGARRRVTAGGTFFCERAKCSIAPRAIESNSVRIHNKTTKKNCLSPYLEKRFFFSFPFFLSLLFLLCYRNRSARRSNIRFPSRTTTLFAFKPLGGSVNNG